MIMIIIIDIIVYISQIQTLAIEEHVEVIGLRCRRLVTKELHQSNAGTHVLNTCYYCYDYDYYDSYYCVHFADSNIGD